MKKILIFLLLGFLLTACQIEINDQQDLKNLIDKTSLLNQIYEARAFYEDSGITVNGQELTQEAKEKLDVAINIYTFENSVFICDRYPVFTSKSENKNVLNLLYFTNDEFNYHYVWIRNYNGFLFDIRKNFIGFAKNAMSIVLVI